MPNDPIVFIQTRPSDQPRIWNVYLIATAGTQVGLQPRPSLYRGQIANLHYKINQSLWPYWDGKWNESDTFFERVKLRFAIYMDTNILRFMCVTHIFWLCPCVCVCVIFLMCFSGSRRTSELDLIHFWPLTFRGKHLASFMIYNFPLVQNAHPKSAFNNVVVHL